MLLSPFFFVRGTGRSDFVGVLDGETGRWRGIGFGRSHQIVKPFIAAMEILVLLLDVRKRRLLALPLAVPLCRCRSLRGRNRTAPAVSLSTFFSDAITVPIRKSTVASLGFSIRAF